MFVMNLPYFFAKNATPKINKKVSCLKPTKEFEETKDLMTK